ncbi:unnamed protein product, partial [Protopolystoma xenopodis]
RFDRAANSIEAGADRVTGNGDVDNGDNDEETTETNTMIIMTVRMEILQAKSTQRKVDRRDESKCEMVL